MMERVALVTGATRGIGRAAAIALARTGVHVILVARGIEGLEAVDDEIQQAGGHATLTPLDLRAFDALDVLGASIYERWGRLDAFFANAGVLGAVTPLAHLDPAVFQELLDVNVTANWRLIRALDPLLRRSEAGRALFVSSGAARKSRPYWGGYAMAKAALESLAFTYAAECEGTKVKVNVLNPGPVRTSMRAQAMPGEDPLTLPAPEDLAPLIVKMLSAAYVKSGELVTFQK